GRTPDCAMVGRHREEDGMTTIVDERRLALKGTLSESMGSAVPFLVVLAFWFAMTHGPWALEPLLLPPPESVLAALWRLVREPFAGSTLAQHILSSVNRWGTGFLVAVAFGVPFGIAVAWNHTFRSAVKPIFEVIRYIPPFA